jgi:hypothetical protein
VAYTNIEGREGLLNALAVCIDEIGTALACVSEAYEKVDDQTADRLEQELFGPVQRAYGRAKSTHSEFAGRHRLADRRFGQPVSAAPPSTRPGELIQQAATAAEAAEHSLVELQDDQALVEVGDVELRAGVAETRDAIGVIPGRAGALLRTLGR